MFAKGVPVEAPAEGYALIPSGALVEEHNQSRRMTRHQQEGVKLIEDASVLCGFRGIRNPIMAILLNPNHGPVRHAMSEALHADLTIHHRPFIDPTRPEGYTHVVDEEAIPEPEAPVDSSRKRVEWRTNLYS